MTGPASAGSRTVCKRVMHWKIDMFIGTAESYGVFSISNLIFEILNFPLSLPCFLPSRSNQKQSDNQMKT